MDEMSSQSSDDLKGGKKIKSFRPIILLRRNSCNNIAACKNENTSSNNNMALPFIRDVQDGKENSSNTAALTNKSNEKTQSYSIINNNNMGIKTLVPAIKTEIVENSVSVSWNDNGKALAIKQPFQNFWQPTSNLNNAIVHEDKRRIQETFSLPTQMLPQKKFIQPNSIALQQQAIPANLPILTNTHYQNVNPITIPMNDSSVSPLVQFGNEQFSAQSNFQCGQYFYSSVVQNPANHLQVPIQENRHMLFQPNSSHGIVSEGAILQTYRNGFHVQNPSLQQNTNMQMKATRHSSAAHNQLDAIADDSLTNITWLGKMGVNNFMPVPLEKEKRTERNDKRGRPPYSYMALIQFAINSSATGRMTLRQIYEWIEEKFPYFKTAKPGWKNSIRHNLSLHDLFVREVSNGSKASYWTLRPDLNVRPLTLDSVGSSSAQGPIWSLQSVGQGQKPILPQLPYCSRPYILLPVPLLQNSKETTSKTTTIEATDSINQDVSTSSSLLVDSGLHSDISYCTPSVNSKTYSNFSETSSNFHNDSEILLKSDKKTSDENCSYFSRTNSNVKTSSKRSRKEPLKTLNDSLNSSLQFVKEELNSPPGPHPDCVQKLSKKKEFESAKPMNVGLSDESFSELLNDLGSPFKSYLTQESNRNKISSPKVICARKRRRSWGSPESSGSGVEFQRKIKEANEKTPPRLNIRRVKSELIDLTQDCKSDSALPTSTPLLKEKWKKSSNQCHWDEMENKENMTPSKRFLTNPSSWRRSEISRSENLPFAPSPILNAINDRGADSNFFEDIIGSVFKTPDKPSAPVQHFDSLSPSRMQVSSAPELCSGSPHPDSNAKGECSKLYDPMSYFVGSNTAEEEPLNTSFSKLLDISGNGSFGRIPSPFPDIDLTWPNLSNL